MSINKKRKTSPVDIESTKTDVKKRCTKGNAKVEPFADVANEKKRAEDEEDRVVSRKTLAIVGSRSFFDYDLLVEKTDALIDYVERDGKEEIAEIVSGGARGTDALGKKYAIAKKLNFRELLPDWIAHGKKAGILRNSEIISTCDYVIAFWDGKSPGTRDSITKGKKQGKMTIRHRLEYDKCCIVYSAK
jgi:hypothetical protein